MFAMLLDDMTSAELIFPHPKQPQSTIHSTQEKYQPLYADIVTTGAYKVHIMLSDNGKKYLDEQ
jgi:hypothetical protein